MKVCPKCNAQLDSQVPVCPNCGYLFQQTNNQQQYAQSNVTPNYYQSQPQQSYAPYDHTAEFDPQDISDNKVYAMLPYLLGWIGIIVAILGGKSSKFVSFHVRQVLKIKVAETLMWIVASLTFWLLFIPIFAAGIMSCVLFVIKIICFFQICSGKAKEPVIIRSLGFLK